MKGLAMRCFLLAFMIVLAPAAAQAGGMERDALAAVNAARIKAGCPALVLNEKLQAAAEGHARAMSAQNFFSHTGQDGSKLKDRIKRSGYAWRALAENIAAGQSSAAEVVANWLASAGHQKNILNCAYVETGLAVVHDPNDAPLKGYSHPFHYYWVQTFGKP